MQEENAEGESEPGDGNQQSPEGIAATKRRGRPGQDFEGIKEEEGGDGEKRETFPALEIEPGGSGGEFEPASDEELEEQCGDRGSEEDTGRDGDELAGREDVKENEREAE